jgi:uncharacterized protein YbjT (DUF2867 family)
MTTSSKTIVITGAFSYTGKYATRILLDRGWTVRTLTDHPDRSSPFGNNVTVFPYSFDRPEQLVQAMTGASTLANTYWVRFPHGNTTFDMAVRNTRTLISAAKQAGIERIVHVSIAKPSLDSPLDYYRGKAELEKDIAESGLAYTILRPTVIFGPEDILINNIAWFVRRFPVFGIPGDGRYKIRPIYVEDMARLIADAAERTGNTVLEAVGPETYSFEGLVKVIAERIGRPSRIMHLPAALAYVSTLVTGWWVGDVILTWPEYRGLMDNLLAPEGPPTGQTSLSQWLADNRDRVGRQYASEVARHFAKS